MAVAHIALIWIAAAVVFFLLVLASTIFVNTYKHRYDRDPFVTTVCVLALTSLLATVCLLPVDIALVSSTTDNRTGLKKEWATDEVVSGILLQLKIVYYLLYSVNALMCLIVVPFAYFLYEEQDDDTSLAARIRGALKYCIGLILLVLIMFLVGFFLPVASSMNGRLDLEYFKRLLMENHGERALTFIIGVLLCAGTLCFVIYTAPGFALLPVALIKSVPSESDALYVPNTRQELLEIQEELRIIGDRAGAVNGFRLSDKDRKAVEILQRRERTLLRKIAMEEEERRHTWLLRFKAVMRPFKIFAGLVLFSVASAIWISMLLTVIDKMKNSPCGARCGYILPHIEIFNPINTIFVLSSKFFPLDYVLTILLVLDLFVSTVFGISFVGIRFLWVTFFRVRKGRTRPQGLLFTTVILTLSVLAFNYALPMIIAPQYGHFGGQVYCTLPSSDGDAHPSCLHHPEYLSICTESANTKVCTPTVVSTFINRVTLNFPFFGAFAFWAQLVFLGIFILVSVVSILRAPKVAGVDQEDDEFAEEEEEEESLLQGSRRRWGRDWTWEEVAAGVTPPQGMDGRAEVSSGIHDV